VSNVAVIEKQRGEVSPVGWQPEPNMSFEEWREAGLQLGQIARATQWWIGDWLNYGATTYGEKYVQAIEETGYDIQSLMNMAYVAGQFEISRRRENLSWSHHCDLAGMEPDEQEDLLDRAEQEGLSTRQLRVAAKGNGRAPAKEPPLKVTLTFEQSFSNRQLQRQTVETLREQAEALGFTER
jgi:hypothetical protein